MTPYHSTHRVRMTALTIGMAAFLSSPLPVLGFAGGNGSAGAPYQVATAEHLDAVRNHLGAHFVQTAPIDLGMVPWNAGDGWQPIGTAAMPFTGSYDGDDFVIGNLTINRPTESDVGLFGVTTLQSSIQEIRLVNASVIGGESIGTLAGTTGGGVARCHATGTAHGGERVGGLVGSGSGIADSSADVAVTGTARVGGLVGSGGGITGSKAHGAVSGGDDVGGLLGHGAGVSDSYATGAVTGGDRVAGLIGNSNYDEPLRCYATGAVTATGLSGGLGSWIMYHSRACFWDVETSGTAGSSGGKGLTTAQMQTPSAFGNAGWAGHGWVMNPGEYPRREWEAAGAPAVPAAVPVPLAGGGTPGNPYLIGTAAELASLSWHAAVLDSHLQITTNIDCEGVELYPLGDLGPFTGVLEGGGFTIFNVTLDFPQSDSVGLLGSLGDPGVVRNVRLANANVSGRHNTGALVGDMFGHYVPKTDHLEWYPARVENCHVQGHVTGYSIAGGMVGMVHISEVTDSSSTVEVNGSFAIGGLAGYVSVGTLDRCNGGGKVVGIDSVGGLAGVLFGVDVYRHIPEMTHKLGKIEACRSSAEVTGQDDVGGLVGHQWGDVIAGPGVLGCAATGRVSGRDRVGGLLGHNEDQGIVADSGSTGKVTANDDAGGLVGRSVTGGDIRRCYSLGEIQGRSNLGGLVGYQDAAQIRQSFARGRVVSSGSSAGGLLGSNNGSSLVSNCYATGVVSGGFSGGLVGMNVASTIANSYSTGQVSGFTAIGGLLGYNVMAGTETSYWDTVTSQLTASAGGAPRTTAEMTHPHDANTYLGWDFTGVWAADADATRNHGYPYLAGVTPLPAMVAVAAIPAAGGSVAGGGTYPPGSAATVSASPAEHHHFLGWEVDGEIISTQVSYSFAVSGGTALTARFALDRHLITVAADPAELGSVSGAGEYEHGDLVTVTATPAAGAAFVHWLEGGTMVSDLAVYEFTAAGPRNLMARFGLPIVFGGGSGTAMDPYLIASPLHLHNVRQVPGAHFRQTADIDLGVAPWNAGEGWEPIGHPENPWDYQPDEVFGGQYDGGGFTIRNLTIVRPEQRIQGLFGLVDGGEIRNLTLENATITADSDSGALAGLVHAGLISNCHSSGSIQLGEWGYNAGGLIGILWPGGVVEHASSSATVAGHGAIGGLIGQAAGTVRRSSASGAVTGSWYAGGFAGQIGGSFIENCHATGAVTDPNDMGPIGGFAGGERWLDMPMTIRNCYATGAVVGDGMESGGFIGVWGSEWDEPEFIVAVLENCYWNTESSGLAESAAGEPRNSAQMTHPHDPTTYVGWDFDAVWAADTVGTLNDGYPYLRAPTEPPPGVDELLANPSFDEEMGAGWNVADEDDRAWIFGTPGEADLHAAGFIGCVIWQDFDLPVAGGAAFDVAMRLSRGHAPDGASTEVRLDYEDGDGQRQSLLVLAPDNDEVAFYPDSTLFTGRATLPAAAAKLRAFCVDRAGPGMFFAMEFSLMAAEPGAGPFTLTYHAGSGGSMVGPSPQTVAAGENGSMIIAEADDGAEFHQWSDGSRANPRTDENVTSDIEVTAHFRSTGGVDIGWYAGHGIAPDEGQTWADLDPIVPTGKTFTLRQHFVAMLDPNDPQSRFATDAPVRAGNTVEIHFHPSSPDRRYTLWKSTNLADWSEVPGQINVPGGSGPLVDDTPPTDNAFYRVAAGLP